MTPAVRTVAIGLCSFLLVGFGGCAEPASFWEDEAADGVSETMADASPSAETGEEPMLPGLFLAEEAQREGDAARGYEVLLSGDYVGCGIPLRIYELVNAAGGLAQGPRAPGGDARVPYYLSVAREVADIDLVSPNCLTCHAGMLNGELVMGLGSTDLDYTSITGVLGQIDGNVIDMIDRAVGLSPDERAELTKFTERMTAVLPYVTPHTAGVNPADNLAAILFAHRDPETLAWSEEPLIEPPPTEVVPLDVPPWWRMKKRHSMLYTGSGRGDHARIMMTASTLCVDSTEKAALIDTMMPDLRAYILSLEAPAYPGTVDLALAEEGEALFLNNCSGCHGTYGADAHYPNIVVPVEVVGTDAALAAGASQFAERFVHWFNNSYYGETAYLEPHEGYVPPPLDGIWATAPFLHNGSVPTLSALLDSSQRPTYWRRTFRSTDYDLESMGWIHTVLDHGHAQETNPDLRRTIYDTTLFGYGNQGHTFGDALSSDERRALLEYLKTL